MANHYGSARSNYFRVKEAAAFKMAMGPFSVEIWDRTAENGDVLFALGSMNDGGDWPSYDEDTDTEFDFIDILAPLVADGEIVVLQSSGSENLRYVTGHAIAFNNQGKHVQVNIDDIYKLAKRKFKIEPTHAIY